MDAASEVVTVTASNATATTIQKSTDTFNVNQSNNNNNTTIQPNTHSSSNSLPNKTTSNLIGNNSGVGNSSSCLNIAGSSNSNSSCSSSSASSNSSGYGSSTTTPTNNYDLQNTTPTTTPIPTTPVANTEHIIPVATVAAVTPFYNEAITTHNLETQNHHHPHQQQTHQLQQQTQQQHVLPNHQHQQYSQNYLPANVQQQQHHQYLPRQQYFSPYDYQQPAPTHNFSASTATPAVGPYNMLIPGAYELPSSAYGASQYKSSNSAVATPYERSPLVKTNVAQSYTQQPPQQHVEQHESRAINQHSTGLLPSTKPKSSSSLIGNSTSSNTSKPQATATPFYANPTPFYDNYKHKIPFDYHDTYSNSPPNSASTYHQQQKYYAAAKSQLKEASYGSPAGFNSKSAYANTGNMFPAPTGGLNLSSASSYDKYMYSHAAHTAGFTATGHLGNEIPPEVNNYRKPVVGANINSHSWPWGIEYASGNSRSLPPPASHIPTATVAPTHATHLTQNPSVLARDPFYVGHDKYVGKYDKYSAPAYPQTYVSPPTNRHMWPNTPHASQLNERHLLASGPPGLTSHGLHSSSYYPNNPATALNSRQTCCSQPYQSQSCYYPVTHPVPPRLPHSQNPTAAQPLPSASYLPAQQPLGQTHHLNALTASCKYGGVLPDYGNTNKIKTSNDLFLNSHHYDNNPPSHNYGYATAHSSSQQLYNPNAHQTMTHGNAPTSLLTNDPLNANPTSYTNDLNLTTSNFDNYHTHIDSHPSQQTLSGIHNTQQPPAYGPTAAKRALLDYRKPIQPQPPPTIPEDCYTSLTSRGHYNQHELLNTPETTTTFDEYEVQQNQATDLSTEVLNDPAEVAGDSNKNLSLRDFIANWNDDEDEYQNNEEINFDQTAVINEVLQTAPVEQEAAAEVVTIQEVKVIKPATAKAKDDESLEEPNKLAEDQSALLKDKESAQYVNLPDIVIDIKKSNNVSSSITTPTTSPTPNAAQAVETASSVNLTDFDVEKELDELNLKKSPQKEITKEINDIKDSKYNQTPQQSPGKTLNSQLSFEDLSLEPTTKTVLSAITTGLVTDQGLELNEQYIKDIEGYESSSSRHSNESAFEKEYETFINKITSETDTLKTGKQKSPENEGEIDFDKNVQDFSKFYKRKRKLKEDELKSSTTTSQSKKKAKTMDASKAHNSNFPQVYTKKSRNRFSKTKMGKSRSHKPLSAFYKIIYTLRYQRLQRLKRVREFMLELKDKHLPLIKRQSIKNYTPDINENIFHPKTLKSLCIMVFNTEVFRQSLGLMQQQGEEECLETEQKHICTDPTCETCEVIKSLMEAESFEATLLQQPEEPSTVYCTEVAKETITILEDITISNELNLSTEDTIIIANTIEENQFLQQNLPEIELSENFQMSAEPLQPAISSLTDLNLDSNLSTLDEALMDAEANKFQAEDGIGFLRQDLTDSKSSREFEAYSKEVDLTENEPIGFDLPIDENFIQPITETSFFENIDSQISLEGSSLQGNLGKCEQFRALNEDILAASDSLQVKNVNDGEERAELKTADLEKGFKESFKTDCSKSFPLCKEKSCKRETDTESKTESSDSSDSETESSSSDTEDSSKSRSSHYESSDTDNDVNEEEVFGPASEQPRQEVSNQKEKEQTEKSNVAQKKLEQETCSSPKTTSNNTIIPDTENHPNSPERIVLRITKSLKSNEQSLRVENISRKAVKTQNDNPSESGPNDKEEITNKKTEVLDTNENSILEKETDQQLAESCKAEKKLVTPLKLVLRGKEYLRVKTIKKSLKLQTESENKSESESEKEEPVKQLPKPIRPNETQAPAEQKEIRMSKKKVKVMLKRCSGKTTPTVKLSPNYSEKREESVQKDREKIEMNISEENIKTSQASEIKVSKDITIQEREEKVHKTTLDDKSKEYLNSPKSESIAEDKEITETISISQEQKQIQDNSKENSDLDNSLLRFEESSKSLAIEDTMNDEPNEGKAAVAIKSPSQRSDSTVLFRTEILSEEEDTQPDSNLLLSPQEYHSNETHPQHDFMHDIELEKASSFAVVFENRDDHILGNLNRSSSLEIIETYSLTSSDEEESEIHALTDSESCKVFNYDTYNDDDVSLEPTTKYNDSKTIVISDDDSLEVPSASEIKGKPFSKAHINKKVVTENKYVKYGQKVWADESKISTKNSTCSKVVKKPQKVNGPKNKDIRTNLPLGDSFKSLETGNFTGLELKKVQPANPFDVLKKNDTSNSDHDFSESTFDSEEESDPEIVWRSNAEKEIHFFDTFPLMAQIYGNKKDEVTKTPTGKLEKIPEKVNKPKAKGKFEINKDSLKSSSSQKITKETPTALVKKQNRKETKSIKTLEKELKILPGNAKKSRSIQNETKKPKRSIKNKQSLVDASEHIIKEHHLASKVLNSQEKTKCNSRKSCKPMSDKQYQKPKARGKKVDQVVPKESMKAGISEQAANKIYQHQIEVDQSQITDFECKISSTKIEQKRQIYPENVKSQKLISVNSIIESDIESFSSRSCSPITKKSTYEPQVSLKNRNTFEKNLRGPAQLIPKTKAACKYYDVQNIVQEEDISDAESEKPCSDYETKACSELLIDNKSPLSAPFVSENKVSHILEETKSFESESDQNLQQDEVQDIEKLNVSRHNAAKEQLSKLDNYNSLEDNINEPILQISGEVNPASEVVIAKYERIPALSPKDPNIVENKFEASKNEDTEGAAAENSNIFITEKSLNADEMQTSDEVTDLQEYQDDLISNDSSQDVMSNFRVLQKVKEQSVNRSFEINGETVKQSLQVQPDCEESNDFELLEHSQSKPFSLAKVNDEEVKENNETFCSKTTKECEATNKSEKEESSTFQIIFDEGLKNVSRVAEEKADISVNKIKTNLSSLEIIEVTKEADEDQVPEKHHSDVQLSDKEINKRETSSTVVIKIPDSETRSQEQDSDKSSVLRDPSDLTAEFTDLAGEAKPLNNDELILDVSKDLLATLERTLVAEENDLTESFNKSKENVLSKSKEISEENDLQEELLTSKDIDAISDVSSTSEDTSSNTEESDDEPTDEEGDELVNIKLASDLQVAGFDNSSTLIEDSGLVPVLKYPSEVKNEKEKRKESVKVTKQVSIITEIVKRNEDYDLEEDSIISAEFDQRAETLNNLKVMSREDSKKESREGEKQISIVAELGKQIPNPTEERDLSLEASNLSKETNKEELGEEDIKQEKVVSVIIESERETEEAFPTTSSFFAEEVDSTLLSSKMLNNENSKNKTKYSNNDESSISEPLKDNEEISLEQGPIPFEELGSLPEISNLSEVINKEMSKEEPIDKEKNTSITSDVATDSEENDLEESSLPAEELDLIIENSYPSKIINKENILEESREYQISVTTERMQKGETNSSKRIHTPIEEPELLTEVGYPSELINKEDMNEDSEGEDVSVVTERMKQSETNSLVKSPIPTEKLKVLPEADCPSKALNIQDINEEHIDEDILVVTKGMQKSITNSLKESPVPIEELEDINEEAYATESMREIETNSLGESPIKEVADATENLREIEETNSLLESAIPAEELEGMNEESKEEDVSVVTESMREIEANSLVESPIPTEEPEDINEESIAEPDLLPEAACSSKIMNIDDINEEFIEEDISVSTENMRKSEPNSILTNPTSTKELDPLTKVAYSSKNINKEDINEEFKEKDVYEATESLIPTQEADLLPGATYSSKIMNIEDISQQCKEEDESIVTESMRESETSSLLKRSTSTEELDLLSGVAFPSEIINKEDINEESEEEDVLEATNRMQKNVTTSLVEIAIPTKDLEDINEESIEEDTRDSVKEFEKNSLGKSPIPTEEPEDINEESIEEDVSDAPESMREIETSSLLRSPIPTEEPEDINEASVEEDLSVATESMREMVTNSLVESPIPTEEPEDINEESKEEDASESMREIETSSLVKSSIPTEEPEDINEESIEEDVSDAPERMREIEAHSLVKNPIPTEEPEDVNEDSIEEDLSVATESMTGIETNSLAESPIPYEESEDINEEFIDEDVSVANESMMEMETNSFAGSTVPTEEAEDIEEESIEEDVSVANESMREIETNSLVKSPVPTEEQEAINEESIEEDVSEANESMREIETNSLVESPIPTEKPDDINEESIEEDVIESMRETEINSLVGSPVPNEELDLLPKITFQPETINKKDVHDESLDEDVLVATQSMREKEIDSGLKRITPTEELSLSSEVSFPSEISDKESISDEFDEKDEAEVVTCSLTETSNPNEVQDLLPEITHPVKVNNIEDINEESNEEDISKTTEPLTKNKASSLGESSSTTADSVLTHESAYKMISAEDINEEPQVNDLLGSNEQIRERKTDVLMEIQIPTEEVDTIPSFANLSSESSKAKLEEEEDTPESTEEVIESKNSKEKFKEENKNVSVTFNAANQSEKTAETLTEEQDLSCKITTVSKELLEEEKDISANTKPVMEIEENSLDEHPTTTKELDHTVVILNSKVISETYKNEKSEENNRAKFEIADPAKENDKTSLNESSIPPEKIDILPETSNISKIISQEDFNEDSQEKARDVSVSKDFVNIEEYILEERPIPTVKSELTIETRYSSKVINKEQSLVEEEDTSINSESLKETEENIIQNIPGFTEELYSPEVYQLSRDTNEDESKGEDIESESVASTTLKKCKLNQDNGLNEFKISSNESDFTAAVIGTRKENSEPKIEIGRAAPIISSNYTEENTENQNVKEISSITKDKKLEEVINVSHQLDEPSTDCCDKPRKVVNEEPKVQYEEHEIQSLIHNLVNEQKTSAQAQEIKTSDKTESAKNSEEELYETLKQSDRFKSLEHQVAAELTLVQPIEEISVESSSQVEKIKTADNTEEPKSSEEVLETNITEEGLPQLEELKTANNIDKSKSSEEMLKENIAEESPPRVKEIKTTNKTEESKSSEEILQENITDDSSPQVEEIKTFNKTEKPQSSEEMLEEYNKFLKQSYKVKPAEIQVIAESELEEQPEKITENVGSKSTTQSSVTPDELSRDFYGFKNNNSSFEDESADFHGFEDLEEVARIRQEIENLNDDSTANDGFLNQLSLNRENHKTSTNSLADSSSSEINELEALEKELSQHQLEMPEADEDKETENYQISNVSTNDIEHIKKMLESDEELQTECENQMDKVAHTSKDKSRVNKDNNISYDHLSPLNSKNSIIPKLSDLCRAALNSSLNSSNNLAQQHTETSTILVERELSVEETLAEMYRQAGVLLSDPEDCDNDVPSPGNNEGHDVLLINLQEILNSDNNDVYVLQCDMNDNVLNVVQSSTEQEQERPENAGLNTERVNTLQIILDTQNSEPQIHIISSDSESEVIILSDDDSDISYTPFRAREEHVTIPFINDEEINNIVEDDDGSFDISTIHHEEIVPDNLAKFLEEEFYKYLHEKYVQRNISKYYHANRILKKYKRRFLRRQ